MSARSRWHPVEHGHGRRKPMRDFRRRLEDAARLPQLPQAVAKRVFEARQTVARVRQNVRSRISKQWDGFRSQEGRRRGRGRGAVRRPSPEEWRALKLEAVERDCPASEVARQALREHLGLGRK